MTLTTDDDGVTPVSGPQLFSRWHPAMLAVMLGLMCVALIMLPIMPGALRGPVTRADLASVARHGHRPDTRGGRKTRDTGLGFFDLHHKCSVREHGDGLDFGAHTYMCSLSETCPSPFLVGHLNAKVMLKHFYSIKGELKSWKMITVASSGKSHDPTNKKQILFPEYTDYNLSTDCNILTWYFSPTKLILNCWTCSGRSRCHWGKVKEYQNPQS